MPHGSDLGEIVNPADPSQNFVDLDKEKGWSEHVEDTTPVETQEVQYLGDTEDETNRKGLRRLLRRNPSVDFIREVAEANTKELDPVEVKKIERKLYLLIVPALAIDYAFYYIDKTTLSYAAIFGIKKDLDLGGDRYSNLSSIFYIGWLAWAIPGNLLLS